MSGRSRGRKSSRAKSRGKGRPRARVPSTADDDVRRDATPPQCQRLGDEPAAAQVQAGAGWGGLETAAAARPGPQPGDAAARSPPGGAAGERGPAKAVSLAERLATDTVFVGTVGALAKLKNGPRAAGHRRVAAGKRASEARGAAARGPQAGLAGRPKRSSAAPGAPALPAGEEKKTAEGRAGPGAPAPESRMDTLETVQLKLETMNAQADRAYLRLSRKFGQLRLHHLERRNLLIQSIPGFWGQAFQNHPQLAFFLSGKDREVLSYLNRLEVEELGLARLGYKIKFYFARNPYFQNKVLIKEYGCGPSGQVVCHSPPIQWLAGHDLQTLSQGSPENIGSFFGWFSNHSSIESDKIVEIINEDLWPNPLQYYLMSEGTGAEKGKVGRAGPAKQSAETPKPGANLSN